MKTKSFQEIRKEHPDQFLVLVDPEEKQVAPNFVEVTGAKYVHAYDDGTEMMEAYRDLRKKGLNVTFCTPNYRESFIIEQIPSLRVHGS